MNHGSKRLSRLGSNRKTFGSRFPFEDGANGDEEKAAQAPKSFFGKPLSAGACE
jgi:hypothetical protein